MKPDTALIGHGESIVYPSGSTIVHYETELVAVIGRKAKNVAREDALGYVLGYACGNDVSERTIQRKEMTLGLMTVGKAFDTFAPIGPCIETSIDPSTLRMRGRLNGNVVQDCQTSDLLFGVDALVAYLSRAITLMPGDLIMTGTPGGIGRFSPATSSRSTSKAWACSATMSSERTHDPRELRHPITSPGGRRIEVPSLVQAGRGGARAHAGRCRLRPHSCERQGR